MVHQAALFSSLSIPVPLDELDRRVRDLVDLATHAQLYATSGQLPAVLRVQFLREFGEFVHIFDAHARRVGEDAAMRLGRRIQAAVMPLMQKTVNGYRWYAKPRGYAGDYLTIARMYEDIAIGEGPVGELLDRCFLDLPAAVAVKNRRALLVDEIRATIRASHGQPARVTSLACGPARELFDVLSQLDEPRALRATLVDLDSAALAHCSETAYQHGVVVDLVEANLIRAATGKTSLPLSDQDLVYSIGLIDYFDDELVIKLMSYIHSILRPGGRVILGNFHPRNPTRAVMDHILEWRLIHRDEEDMDRLYLASAFGRASTRFAYEPQRINLFAECVK